MKKWIIRFLPYIALLVILGVGAYLRLHNISLYMTFLGDEGRDVLVVKRMIMDGKWTLLGPTASVGGFFMGPIYYYFMLPFLWLWKLNPVGPAIMVALFGIATIYLVYHVGKALYGIRVAYIASALYALSPLVISYSRSSWNPNIVPFFSLLLFYLLFLIVVKKRWNLVFFAGVVAGIGVQLHYTFLFLFAACAIWLIVWGKIQKHFKAFCFGIVGFIVGFSPFLAFEVRHGFSNVKAIASFIFEGKDTGFSLSHLLENGSDIFTRLFGRFLLRIPEKGALGNLPVTEKTLWITGTILLALGAIASVVYLWKRYKENKGILLLVIWVGTSLLLFGLYKKQVYDYYLGIMFFAPFFFFGLTVEALCQTKIGMVVGYGITLFLLIFNWQGRPFVFTPNNQLGQVELISREVVSKTDGKPFNFALLTSGNSDHAYRYFFEIWGKAPVTIENDVIDPGRTSVTDQLLIVCEDIFCKPLGNSLWEVAGFGRAEVVGQWDVSVVKVYKLIHYKEP